MEAIIKLELALETLSAGLNWTKDFRHFTATETVRGKTETKSSLATKKLLRLTIDNELKLERHISKMSLKAR